MKLIQEVFGKEHGITNHDVENMIGKVQEMSSIECKLVPNDIGKKEKKEEIIFKPIVGFLNKIDNTGGLLILGAEANNQVVENIKPFPAYILNQAMVSSFIKEYLVPIPNNHAAYVSDVISVDFGNGQHVLLVEIKKNDPSVLFYSKITNSAYERRGHSSYSIEMSELLRRLESMRAARLVLFLTQRGYTSRMNGVNSLGVDFYLTNRGTLPGKYITGLVKLRFLREASIKDVSIIPSVMQDVSNINKDVHRTFQLAAGYPPNTSFVYPGLNYSVGLLTFGVTGNNQDIDISIEAFIYEERTFTKQSINLRIGQTLKVDHGQPAFSNYL